jgi:hypothetical protein
MSRDSVARLFHLEGDGWMRHANAASVWTRFAVLPLLALAIWSRDWIGWWSLVPIALSLVWLGVNPLAFGPPRSTRNWASKSVFGERIWVEHERSELPAQFRSRVPTLISAAQVAGLVPLVYGLVVLDPVAAVCGVLLVQCGKLWYLDRMVLLFEDVKRRDRRVAAWEYGPAATATGRRPAQRGRKASAVGTGRPPGSAMP